MGQFRGRRLIDEAQALPFYQAQEIRVERRLGLLGHLNGRAFLEEEEQVCM
jgi:hypothetical protein